MMQGAFQLLFVVFREVNGQPEIDRGLVRIEQEANGAFQEIKLQGENGLAIISFNLQVSCAQDGCQLKAGCLPRDDLFGHYTCADNGDLVCLPGFQNPTTDCTEMAPTKLPNTDLVTTVDSVSVTTTPTTTVDSQSITAGSGTTADSVPYTRRPDTTVGNEGTDIIYRHHVMM